MPQPEVTRVRLTRRQAIALIAAAATTPRLAKGAEPILRAVPASGEKLPALGLGTWQVLDVPPDGTEFDAALGTQLDALEAWIDYRYEMRTRIGLPAIRLEAQRQLAIAPGERRRGPFAPGGNAPERRLQADQRKREQGERTENANRKVQSERHDQSPFLSCDRQCRLMKIPTAGAIRSCVG